MTEKHVKRCSTFLTIWEMQIKTTSRFLLTLSLTLRWITEVTLARMRRRATPSISDGMPACSVTMEINMAVHQKVGNQSISRPRPITLGHTPKGCSMLHQEHLFKFVHCGFIHNNQQLETALIFSTKEWIK